jgi:antitoxin MazE
MAKAKTVIKEAVRMGSKNQITIPYRISKAMRLKKGDHILVRLLDRRVELILIPKDQLWFWTSEWQRKEREVDEALASGDIEETDSVKELFKELHRRS